MKSSLARRINCSWILPTYVDEVPYARAKDIDFSSAKKYLVKEKPDQRIENLQQPQAPSHRATSSSGTASAGATARIGTFERRNWLSFMLKSTSAKLNCNSFKFNRSFC